MSDLDDKFDAGPDLDSKIERLFGLIHEELRTLRDLVTAKVSGLKDLVSDHEIRIADHEARIAALEAASKGNAP